MSIRPEKDSFYDFKCGNDFKRIKLAVKNNTYHAVKIQADIAQTINFTGGMAHVDEVLLYKCFKFTRIIWPEDCGYINILKIHAANSLINIDVSPLQELEQLSIMDCTELSSISGFGKKLKSILIFGGKIKDITLSHLNNLENIIIVTSSPIFNLNVDHCYLLKSVDYY